MTTESTSLITDEMIEVGARAASDAFCKRWRVPPDVWPVVWERDAAARREQTRAALEAVLPMVGERFELAVYRALASNPVHGELAATAIRALSKRQE